MCRMLHKLIIIIFVYCSLVVATRIPDFTTVRVAQQTNDPKYLCYMGFTADIIITDCIVSDWDYLHFVVFI